MSDVEGLEREEQIEEMGGALIEDAHAWIGRIGSVWQLFSLLSNLFPECITQDELLSHLPRLRQIIPLWGASLTKGIKQTESDVLMRKVQILKKRLEFGFVDRGTPVLKSLVERLDEHDLVRTIEAWSMDNLPDSNLDIPLHELFTLNLGRAGKKLTNPRFIETFQMAMKQPSFYLGKDPSMPEDTVIFSDTPTLYKLTMECGKYINTHDWFISFRECVNPQRTIPEAELIPRFLRSVHELQMVGVVAPTRKRKDHYERILLFHRQ